MIIFHFILYVVTKSDVLNQYLFYSQLTRENHLIIIIFPVLIIKYQNHFQVSIFCWIMNNFINQFKFGHSIFLTFSHLFSL